MGPTLATSNGARPRANNPASPAWSWPLRGAARIRPMIGTSSHYHLGCGPQHLDGFVNVDVRDTQAADLVADLNTLDGLPPGEAKGFFSHAFFEHLYRDSRLGHLRAARERLASDGFVCYIGLPDFQRVAELYLSQGRGVEGPTFDLHNEIRR